VLFEQRQILESATRLEEADCRSEARKSGEVFSRRFPPGPTVIIKGVLHDFNDEQCVRILSNCRRAVSAEGRLLIAKSRFAAQVGLTAP
jgi:hypothetical protein